MAALAPAGTFKIGRAAEVPDMKWQSNKTFLCFSGYAKSSLLLVGLADRWLLCIGGNRVGGVSRTREFGEDMHPEDCRHRADNSSFEDLSEIPETRGFVSFITLTAR